MNQKTSYTIYNFIEYNGSSICYAYTSSLECLVNTIKIVTGQIYTKKELEEEILGLKKENKVLIIIDGEFGSIPIDDLRKSRAGNIK